MVCHSRAIAESVLKRHLVLTRPVTDAVRYQIVIMFMIAAATALGTLCVILLAFRKLFNAQHQLCIELLQSTKR